MARLERANAGVKVLCLPPGDIPKWKRRGGPGLFPIPRSMGWDKGLEPSTPEPQSGALPTELIPPYTFQSFCFDAGAPGGTRTPGLLLRRQLLYPAELLAHIQEPSENGAGEGNRTLVPSLEGWYSTIELHPQAMRAYHYPRRMSRVPERKNFENPARHGKIFIRSAVIELVRFVFRLAGEVDLELGERVLIGTGENDGRVRLAPGEIVERLHRP